MPTHYELLNISSTADDATMKRAYHKIALVNHPDKTIHLDAVERSRREKLFKDANTAFEILFDALKRAAYDRGLRTRARIPANPSSNRPTASAPAEAKRRQERDERSQQYTNPFARPPPPPPPKPNPPPPPKPTFPQPQPNAPPPARHIFSSGAPPGTWDTAPNAPWFYAPVSDTPERTTFDFSNHHGWHFTIAVAKHFKFKMAPVVPLWIFDTSKEIVIKIFLARQQCSIPFMKDVVLNVRKSPGSRQTALSSVFVETHDGGGELRVTLATNDEVCAAPSWTWAFDADFGFLAPMYKEMRVTHQEFWPVYPAHAVRSDGEVPEGWFPEGSPMANLKKEYPRMAFVKLSKGF